MSFACIYVPNFLLQALLYVESTLRDHSLAILDGHLPLPRIIALEEKARRAGVTLGMPQNHAALLGVTLRRRSFNAEIKLHKKLIKCALVFSPLIEDIPFSSHSFSNISENNHRESWILLDLHGTEKAHGSFKIISQKIKTRVDQMGLHCNIGIAENPDTAIIAARGIAGITIISPGHEAEQLKSLSVHLLNLIPDHRKIFFLWGIRTLGDLANLPDIGLVKRLGLEGKRLKTLAQGKHNRPLVPINKDLNFQESLELDFPIEKTEALLFVLFRLLNSICTKMNSKRLSASNLSLYLEFESLKLNRGPEYKENRDKAVYSATFNFPEPLNNSHIILKLLHLHLADSSPQGPITKIHVHVKTTRSSQTQGLLLNPAIPEPGQLQLTLEQISTIVGNNKVGSPYLPETHQPDAYQIKTFSPDTRSKLSSSTTHTKKSKIASPSLRRFRPPIPTHVETKKNVPCTITFKKKRQEILDAAGPWKLSGHWWKSSHWCREEWDISLFKKKGRKRAIYKIYYDCQRSQWYIEGLYD